MQGHSVCSDILSAGTFYVQAKIFVAGPFCDAGPFSVQGHSVCMDILCCKTVLCAGTLCVQGHSVAGDSPFWHGDQGGPKESQLASTVGFGSGLYSYLHRTSPY